MINWVPTEKPKNTIPGRVLHIAPITVTSKQQLCLLDTNVFKGIALATKAIFTNGFSYNPLSSFGVCDLCGYETPHRGFFEVRYPTHVMSHSILDIPLL